MKTVSASLFIALFYLSSSAQNFFQDMENEVLKCRLFADGTFFDNPGFQLSSFKYPKNSETQTIDVAALFISALNNNGKLCVANGMLHGKTDFTPGPIATNYVSFNNGIADSTYDYTYNSVWKISKAEIDYHVNNYNQPNYNIPWVINNWPANGNTLRGEAEKLAPFMDLNNNNRYEPQLGEYPIIVGDVAVYMIYNSARKDSALRITRFNVPFVAMNLEIHSMAYAFNNEGEDLNNTLFVNHKIYNRSTTESYNDMYIGQRTYLVTNCPSNPTSVGCDSSLSYYYNYAFTDIDNCTQPYSFENYVPAFGVVFLSDTMRSFLQHDNFDANNYGDPVFATDYSAYTRGMLKDSMAYGAQCSLYTGVHPTKYMLNDYPMDSAGYSTYTCNIANGYGKCVGGIGPFNIAPQEHLCLDMAFTFARDSSNNNTNFKSLEKLKLRVSNLHSLYAQNRVGCNSIATNINEKNTHETELLLYPNPASHEIKISMLNSKQKIKNIKVYDIAGSTIMHNNYEAEGQHYTLNIAAITSGIYFIEVAFNTGQIARVKFIKQ